MKAKFYITLSIVAIIGLSVVRVVVTNNISTNGAELGELQEKVKQIKKENALLHEEILESSSLNYVASQAAEVGFVPSKTQMVVSSPLPLALNNEH